MTSVLAELAGRPSVSEVLSRAADLLEPQGAWCQGDFARTANGDSLENGFDKGAVCFCAIGAIEHIAGDFDRTREPKGFAQSFVGEHLSIFNDAPGRTQAEVVAKLREASLLASKSS